MLFDTHAHLNFAAFENNVEEVIRQANEAGVSQIVIPGSNIANSKRGAEIAQKNKGIYAAVGIHPYHLYGHFVFNQSIDQDLQDLEKLLKDEKVVAIGEVGLDKHQYKTSKYPDYSVSEGLVNLQKEVFIKMVKLAIKHNKSLIVHNRDAGKEVLEILEENWSKKLGGRVVFHFCEPDQNLLNFAKEHRIYIGVDGDITYDYTKQDFVKQIPLELLVLETDSPYVLPEPLKSQEEKINTPASLKVIADFLSELLGVDHDSLAGIAQNNSQALFLSTENRGLSVHG